MDKKAAKLAYKASRTPVGVFQVRNLANGMIFVGSSLNLSAMFNRIRFQLIAGSHPNKRLESDWMRYGTGKFEFEILEELPPQADATYNYAAELEALEKSWLEKLQPYNEKGYNEKKKTRDEKTGLSGKGNS